MKRNRIKSKRKTIIGEKKIDFHASLDSRFSMAVFEYRVSCAVKTDVTQSSMKAKVILKSPFVKQVLNLDDGMQHIM